MSTQVIQSRNKREGRYVGRTRYNEITLRLDGTRRHCRLGPSFDADGSVGDDALHIGTGTLFVNDVAIGAVEHLSFDERGITWPK